MQPIHRRDRLLKQTGIIAGAEVAGDSLVDGDVLVYDSTSGEWQTTQTLDGTYTFTQDVSISGTLTVPLIVANGVNSHIRLKATGAVDPNDTFYIDKSADLSRFMHYDSSGASFYTWGEFDFISSKLTWSAPTEIELNATTLDFNGNADVSGTLNIHGTTQLDDTRLVWNDTGAPLNEKLWQMDSTSAGTLYIESRTDADTAGAVPLQILRTGTTIDEVEINATTLDFNGALDVDSSSSHSIASSAGNIVLDTGAENIQLQDNGTLSLDATTVDINANADVSGTLDVGTSIGGQVLSLKPGSADHAYMAWFADTAAPTTRSAWMGFGSVGTDTLTIANQQGTNITLSPNGGTVYTVGSADVSGTLTLESGTYNVNPIEGGISMVGNFGQWQTHGTYADFNVAPAYWGWNYVQGTTNAPHASSSQWYRNRVSLGSEYGFGSDVGDYSLEMAYPRYGQNSVNELWSRTIEDGAEGSWSQVNRYMYDTFRVYESTGGTDYIELNDTGSLAVIESNTNSIRLVPATGVTQYYTPGQDAQLQIYEATATDSLVISQNSAAAALSSTQHIHLQPGAGHEVYVYRAGEDIPFHVYDSSGIYSVNLLHSSTAGYIQTTLGPVYLDSAAGWAGIVGAATGAANEAYLSFVDSAGTRDGYVGAASSGSRNIFLASDSGDIEINSADDISMSASLISAVATPQWSWNSSEGADTVHTLRNPVGAYYDSQTATVAGAIRILFPTSSNNDQMMNIKVKGYSYADGYGAWELTIGGYLYSAGTDGTYWYNTSVVAKGMPQFSPVVRFYNVTGTGQGAIYIGDVSDTGSAYPNCVVEQMQIGYAGQGKDVMSGVNAAWTISAATSTTGYTLNKTHYLSSHFAGGNNAGGRLSFPSANNTSKTAYPYMRDAYGNYGTVAVENVAGSSGTWAGYAIRDDWVFMSNGASQAGIWNDTDDEWVLVFNQNGNVGIYHNGTQVATTNTEGLVKASEGQFIHHASSSYTAGSVTLQSGGSPSGGSNGDIVLIY